VQTDLGRSTGTMRFSLKSLPERLWQGVTVCGSLLLSTWIGKEDLSRLCSSN